MNGWGEGSVHGGSGRFEMILDGRSRCRTRRDETMSWSVWRSRSVERKVESISLPSRICVITCESLYVTIRQKIMGECVTDLQRTRNSLSTQTRLFLSSLLQILPPAVATFSI